MNAGEFNPFEEQIVAEPRRVDAVVPGLNDGTLKALLADFLRLAASPLPRSGQRLPHARLVVSPQPGYGKSHLIGRLFHELHSRAVLVYILPFQNPATVFQSLMLAIARELHFPPRIGLGTLDRESPTH